ELNATGFASRVLHPVMAVSAGTLTPEGIERIALVNAAEPTNTVGAELLARLVRPLGREHVDDPDDAEHDEGGEGEGGEHAEERPTLRVTASYTFLRSTECAPAGITGPEPLRCSH